MTGFSRDGGVTVYICRNVGDPRFMPGVYSAVEGSNHLMLKDGALVDPETEGLTAAELEAISWREMPEAPPAWGRFEE